MPEPPARAGPGERSSTTTGLVAALVAFATWGLIFPLHIRQLGDVSPGLIMAHRIVWATLFAVALLAVRGRFGDLAATFKRPAALKPLGLSAALVGLNWFVYVVAISHGHFAQASLGYFINPLVNVALGIAFLGERLRPARAVACGIAAASVAVLTVGVGSLPVVALTLAVSFGVYGLIRKTVEADALLGFCVESLLLVPLAAGYLVIQALTGAPLGRSDAIGAGLLVATGLTTAVPLICFSIAARNLDLSTVGLLQYMSPTCVLLLGTLVYGEPFGTLDAVAFGGIWTALAIYSLDAWRIARRG